MKILYIHPNAWINEYSILRKLQEMGHEICVLEEDRNKNSPVIHIERYFKEENDNIKTFWYNPKKGFKKIITWPLDRFFKSHFNGRNLGHRIWIVQNAVKYFKPDAIITTEGFAYAIPAAFLKKIGLLKPILVVSYIGGDILDCPEADCGKRRKPITKWLIRQPIHSADVLRAVSPLLKKELVDLGANPHKICIIPSHLFISNESLDKILKQKRNFRIIIREKFGISEFAPVIITLSGNVKGKGIQILASAWNEILKSIPECCWLLCGPQNQWFQEVVLPLINNHLNKSIFLTGKLTGSEIFEYFSAADLHINPTLCEGLNMATVEASAIGLPTITSNKAGIAYWIEKFEAGRIVPAFDTKALAQAIIESFQNPHIIKKWQKNCISLSKEFTLENVAVNIIKLLEQYIQSKKTTEG